MECRICNNVAGNRPYEVREMMFGFKDKFRYFRCSNCGCLQIDEIPGDMSRYYPPEYYSFSGIQSGQGGNPIRRWCRTLRDRYALFNRGTIGRLLHLRFPNATLRGLSRIPLTVNSRILDVGCGSGSLLLTLRQVGFTNLCGIDPYLEENGGCGNGVKILQMTVHDLDGQWDLVMCHHSFEHVPDPRRFLETVSRLMAWDGVCLIRIPTVSSYAWEYYGVDWVQLDAPRHFFLHSLESIGMLGEMANLRLEQVVFDSTEFQFWGSEQYRRDIPLMSARSYNVNPAASIFSRSQMRGFARRAARLNREGRGDQIALYFRHKGEGPG